ncbi:MAG: AtpZ/AtpI family protein [Acidobacteriota bacterium]|nr:AtpZ/AtpI family protein [Acidobacteriota bacterium]
MSSGLESLVEAEKLMQIAILLPASAFIGWLIGAWADSHFHTSWMGTVGIIFGGIAGIVHVVRLAMASADSSGSDGSDGSHDARGNSDNKS